MDARPAPETATLADGTEVVIKPIRDDDEDRLIAFHDALSERSRYFRFFSPYPVLPHEVAHHFAHVDKVDRMALIAEQDGELVAVGRYDRSLEWPHQAEVAFTVADRLQGHGIGTLLLRRLARYAHEHDLSTFTAVVLPDNQQMLQVFADADPTMGAVFDDGAITVTLSVDQVIATTGDG